MLERRRLERACAERVDDIRHERRILNGGPVAEDRLLSNPRFRAEMRGADVRGRIGARAAGVDVVRASVDELCVLESDLRVPSGVASMLENRRMTMRILPERLAAQSVGPVRRCPDGRPGRVARPRV